MCDAMKINYNENFLKLNEIKFGFSTKEIQKISFQGSGFEEKSANYIRDIKDYLENNFKVYQYKDNGVKYGEHDLLYWSNEKDELYFYVCLNFENDTEENKKITSKILKYINKKYNKIDLWVDVQYSNRQNWDIMNEYILSNEFDINNFFNEKIKVITSYAYKQGNGLSKEAYNKLITLKENLMPQLENKKVFYHGIRGTVKKVSEKLYGFYKLRTRLKCTLIDVNNMGALQLEQKVIKKEK